MPVIQGQDIHDLVLGTLKRMDKLKFRQIATKINQYQMLPHWFKKNRMTFESGVSIRKHIMVRTNNAAKHVGLYEPDAINTGDVMDYMQVNWVHATTNWVYDERELLMNRGYERIFNILQPLRLGAMIDMANILEEGAWRLPDPGDRKMPFGIPYWITPNKERGFNGMNPEGYADKGGLDARKYTGWRNWTDSYKNFSRADLITKMRSAYRNTQWKAPVTVPGLQETRSDYTIYTNENTLAELEKLGENQNENLGRDLAGYMDTISFKGAPIRYVRIMDDRKDNPIYMINHGAFSPFVHRDMYLRETKPSNNNLGHNVFAIHVDLSYNFLCVDPKTCSLLIQDAVGCDDEADCGN